MKNPWEQNPYPKKHVHRWVLLENRPAKPAQMDFWYGGQLHPAENQILKRECPDCGVRQICEVLDPSLLVPGYEAVSDGLVWEDY